MSSPLHRERLEQKLAAAAEPRARHLFTRLLPDSARAEADAADLRRKAGIALGPLDGRIISIKDLFDMAGQVTTAGSVILKDNAPAGSDAPTVAALRRAGAILIGRTNMSEFAFSGIGLNPHYGTPGNAVDPARVPGGSTSGGAVSVALGLADLTLGTDTGGSTRIPAAFNGIVGFKPTSSRVSKAGAFPLSYTLDSIGPLGPDVATCAAMDAILAGADPESLPDVSVMGLRLGIPRGLLFEETEPAVADAFEEAISRLSEFGAHMRELSIDDLVLAMRGVLAGAPIAACEAAEIHHEWLQSRAADFDARVLARIRPGASISAPAYITALRERDRLKGEFARRIAPFDALILPTCALQAPVIAALEADPELFARKNVLALRNTSPANFFDCPALSLPLPVSGLPVGLMLLGAPMQDRRLLALGAAVEATLRP
ncbi:amidase [Rhabdaerophilum sp. SD176]|uniref:amidase n=1 Tax=Rhabdaerophilum sp. SD176 TaxID=2983548 RepID=UPI0024E02C80|nr:amidase [Rhabdaerophilum sp. SD176]